VSEFLLKRGATEVGNHDSDGMDPGVKGLITLVWWAILLIIAKLHQLGCTC